MDHGEQLILEVQIFPLQFEDEVRLDIDVSPRGLEVALGQFLSGIGEKPLHSILFYGKT